MPETGSRLWLTPRDWPWVYSQRNATPAGRVYTQPISPGAVHGGCYRAKPYLRHWRRMSIEPSVSLEAFVSVTRTFAMTPSLKSEEGNLEHRPPEQLGYGPILHPRYDVNIFRASTRSQPTLVDSKAEPLVTIGQRPVGQRLPPRTRIV
jgi:hypothetical protein